MAAIRMHIEKFGRVVVIDDHHPLVVAQRALDGQPTAPHSGIPAHEESAPARSDGAPADSSASPADVDTGDGVELVADADGAHADGAADAAQRIATASEELLAPDTQEPSDSEIIAGIDAELRETALAMRAATNTANTSNASPRRDRGNRGRR